MVDPNGMTETLGLKPLGATGLNNLRGVFPGVLLGSGLMMILGLWKKNTTWFAATVLIMAVVAAGRVASFGLDGFDSASLPPLVYELVVVILLVFADRRLAA